MLISYLSIARGRVKDRFSCCRRNSAASYPCAPTARWLGAGREWLFPGQNPGGSRCIDGTLFRKQCRQADTRQADLSKAVTQS